MGVFASRSPFRPNPIGLSSVRLIKTELNTPDGPVLYICGGDLMDGTPVYDIKPYLPYVDSHPDATGGFALQTKEGFLAVDFPPALLERIPPGKRDALAAVLAQDPRPAYQNDPERVYGFEFAGFEVKFTVAENKLSVRDVSESK